MANKINFTIEDQAKLRSLLADFVLDGTTFKGQLNTPVSVIDLVQNSSLNTLKRMFTALSNTVKNKKEATVRWETKETEEDALLTKQIDFIELLIGYKLAQAQNETIEAQKKHIQAQIDRIKESNKTPEELMADLLEQMANLG
jgi:predicted aspartyl protease